MIQGGTGEAARTKQWMRIPMQLSTVFSVTEVLPLPPGSLLERRTRITNYVYLMAENGAPFSYGLTAPFATRSVAFGVIPVSATLRLAQRRTSSNLPVPTVVATDDEFYKDEHKPAGWPTGRRVFDLEAEDRLDVLVESLLVDGQNLHLLPGCRTSEPATLRLFGRGFISQTPGIDTSAPWASEHFAAGIGGLLTGSVTVPPFANCRTRDGEDLSALLTSTVSGPGNEVALHVSPPFVPCGSAEPPLVGEYDPSAHCPDKIPPLVDLPTESP